MAETRTGTTATTRSDAPVVDVPAQAAAAAPLATGAARTAAVLERLSSQEQWYDRHSSRARRCYVSIKVLQIVLAAMVPVLSGASAPAALVGGLGAGIVALEGIQQLFQFHRNWVQYRATANALGHERYLHAVRAGDYDTADDPDGLLAGRVELLLRTEATQWAAQQRQSEPGGG